MVGISTVVPLPSTWPNKNFVQILPNLVNCHTPFLDTYHYRTLLFNHTVKSASGMYRIRTSDPDWSMRFRVGCKVQARYLS